MHRLSLSIAVALAVGLIALGEPATAANIESQVQSLQQDITKLQNQMADLKSQASKQKNIEDILKEMGAEDLPNDLHLYWDDGIRLDTRSGDIQMKFGGRFHYDTTWISGNDLEGQLGIDMLDSSHTRRSRLYFESTMYDRVRVKVEWDFSGGDSGEYTGGNAFTDNGNVVLTDGYIELINLPYVGNIRMGHFKEPLSLQQVTDSNYLTFMERGLPDAFAPGRNAGFMLYDTAFDDYMTWAIGVFRYTDDGIWLYDDATGMSDGDYRFAMRLTGTPYYENNGEQLIHLGFGYEYDSMDNGPFGGPIATTRYSAMPEAAFAAHPWFQAMGFMNTGWLFDQTERHTYSAELAGVWGPWHFAGEFIGVDHDYGSTRVPFRAIDPTLKGWYIQAGYFLTGEVRPYNRKLGAWDRVQVKKPYGKDGGMGAWEIATRFSHLDLDTARVGLIAANQQGDMDDWTLGLNWYLNDNVRVMWNYIHSRIDQTETNFPGLPAIDEEDADILMMRLQFDF